MSQDFKFNFKGSDEKSQSTENDDNLYSLPGNVRNLSFEWTDGQKKFLNYAYLISGEYSQDEDSVTLIFTTETVILKGVNLSVLFEFLSLNTVKRLICKDARYNFSVNLNDYIINEIKVLKI